MGLIVKELVFYGVMVIEVSEIMGFLECFDGCVKILYLKVYVGIFVDCCLMFYCE